MTVGKLIKILKTLDKDMEVIMSSDSEGNNYSPLSDLSNGRYIATCTYAGAYYVDNAEILECDEDPKSAIDVICLWPTN
jgi:hypothetical protein